jgi:acetyl-CoA acyltransferase
LQQVYVVAAKRTAVTKGKTGKLANTRPDDLIATLIKDVVTKTNIDPKLIDDVIIGCATPEAQQGLNIARLSLLLAGLPNSVPGLTINRFCASGLESIATAAAKIKAGQAEFILAGGVESMSLLPFGGHNICPNPKVFANNGEHKSISYSMGITAECVAEKYNISRQIQDEFALHSHHKALVAQEMDIFAQEITPVINTETLATGNSTETKTNDIVVDIDSGPRSDTSLEALKKLKPVFKKNGSVTAGNSSQVSDGAGLVMLASEDFVKTHNLSPLAIFHSYNVAGLEPEFMGMGPVKAVPKALAKVNLNLDDIAHIELNEAFAAQAVAVINELNIDTRIVNPYGGAIALGHPLGATGAIKTATLLHSLKRNKQRYGMVTMCVGTGMGAAGVFESV